MLRFVLRRCAQLVPVLIGLSILLFFWVRALPGDPARSLLGERATDADIAIINRRYGFDQPVWKQYLTYLGSLLHGDFGSSIKDRQPVLETFFHKFPATIELTLTAMVIAIVIGIPLGYYAGRRQGGWIDTVALSGSLVGVVMPVFFTAILLKLVFAEQLHLLPTAFRQGATVEATHTTGFYVLDGIIHGQLGASWDAIQHLILPALALSSIPLAIIVRITRASVAEVVHDDFVRTAEAKGLHTWTITHRHVLRNALLPVTTTVGLQLGALLSGAVLTETVFALEGVGAYLNNAIRDRDYPVLQGFILMIALTYALVNLVVDVSYGFIDPRVRVR